MSGRSERITIELGFRQPEDSMNDSVAAGVPFVEYRQDEELGGFCDESSINPHNMMHHTVRYVKRDSVNPVRTLLWGGSRLCD